MTGDTSRSRDSAVGGSADRRRGRWILGWHERRGAAIAAAQSNDPMTYTVQTGSVGSTARISLAASWSTTRTLHAGRGGTVTSVLLAGGDEAADGTVIATIDLAPLVVATGSVPMFRTLA
jgi:hypothetical protein